jgi:hypothetical protein
MARQAQRLASFKQKVSEHHLENDQCGWGSGRGREL